MKDTIKTKVYVHCSETSKKVKGTILDKNDKSIKVELPTGAILELTKKHIKNDYTFCIGQLEFYSNGKLIS